MASSGTITSTDYTSISSDSTLQGSFTDADYILTCNNYEYVGPFTSPSLYWVRMDTEPCCRDWVVITNPKIKLDWHPP